MFVKRGPEENEMREIRRQEENHRYWGAQATFTPKRGAAIDPGLTLFATI